METVTSTDGTTIAFDQLGEGPPLVLVAGASCDRRADDGLACALARHFTVLNHDRRGRGDSGDAGDYAVEREIDDLAVLVEAAGGSASLVGISSGGALAALAAASELRVERLVLWEPPYRMDPASRAATRTYAARLDEMLTAGRRGEALELFLATVGVPEPVVAGMRSSPYWPQGEALAPTLAYDARIMGDGSVPVDALARVTAPTLVLAGGDSPTWLRESAEATAAAVPAGRCEVLPGQTHDVAPEVLAAAVQRFAGGRP